jgi:hypothetical protein
VPQLKFQLVFVTNCVKLSCEALNKSDPDQFDVLKSIISLLQLHKPMFSSPSKDAFIDSIGLDPTYLVLCIINILN